jgi:hypothetical protein
LKFELARRPNRHFVSRETTSGKSARAEGPARIDTGRGCDVTSASAVIWEKG